MACSRLFSNISYPTQGCFVKNCTEMNERLDTFTRMAECAGGIASSVLNAQHLKGTYSESSAKAQRTLGLLESGVSAFRIPFDLVELSTGNTFCEKGEDNQATSKPALKIAASLALKTARVASAVGFLHRTGACQLSGTSQKQLGTTTQVLWGATSALYLSVAVKDAIQKPEERLSLKDKIMGIFLSVMDMACWLFETVANCSMPKMGIACGALHAVTGFAWFFNDLFSY